MEPGSFTGAIALLFAFLIGHALADFPLQGDFLVIGKNRHTPPMNLPEKDAPRKTLWVYCLTAHSLVHAGFVWAISGSVILGFAELVTHWIFDFSKCEGWTSFHTDQALHVGVKVIYVILIYTGTVDPGSTVTVMASLGA